MKRRKQSKPNHAIAASPRKKSVRSVSSAPTSAGRRPFKRGKKYGVLITRELAIEMLENARRHIVYPPPASWSGVDEILWYDSITEATETLSKAIAVLRPNIREVNLPRPYPDEPGNSYRRYEYSESLRRTAELIYEILETAEMECGQEFQEELKRWVIKQFRRKDVRDWIKPDEKVNLEMIRILREISARCTSHPKELKGLAPDGRDADRWAHDVSVQLKRFCERAHRVWQELHTPLLGQIHLIPNARDPFLAECSLVFPQDTCVAQEAIERGGEMIHRERRRKLLPLKSVRQ